MLRRIVLTAIFALVLTGCPAPVEVLPVASFNAHPAGGYSPLTVQFNDLSTAGTSPITQHNWNFGDSKTSTETNPVHTYNQVGRFTVTLRVVTAVGESVLSKTKFIEVLQPAAGPTAYFSAAPQNGTAPLAVQFTDESTPGDLPITTWRWTFG